MQLRSYQWTSIVQTNLNTAYQKGELSYETVLGFQIQEPPYLDASNFVGMIGIKRFKAPPNFDSFINLRLLNRHLDHQIMMVLESTPDPQWNFAIPSHPVISMHPGEPHKALLNLKLEVEYDFKITR